MSIKQEVIGALGYIMFCTGLTIQFQNGWAFIGAGTLLLIRYNFEINL